MTEINITRFFREACARDYSASVAEIGANAGADTWRAAMDDCEDYLMLDTPELIESFKDHIANFGAWDSDEIAAMDSRSCNALFIQLVSGDMRECDLDCENPDWQAYENNDSLAHNIFCADDGQIYYSFG